MEVTCSQLTFNAHYERDSRAVVMRVQINSDEGSLLLSWEPSDPETFDCRTVGGDDMENETYGFPLQPLISFVDMIRAYPIKKGK